jgi:hypothetical protein
LKNLLSKINHNLKAPLVRFLILAIITQAALANALELGINETTKKEFICREDYYNYIMRDLEIDKLGSETTTSDIIGASFLPIGVIAGGVGGATGAVTGGTVVQNIILGTIFGAGASLVPVVVVGGISYVIITEIQILKHKSRAKAFRLIEQSFLSEENNSAPDLLELVTNKLESKGHKVTKEMVRRELRTLASESNELCSRRAPLGFKKVFAILRDRLSEVKK